MVTGPPHMWFPVSQSCVHTKPSLTKQYGCIRARIHKCSENKKSKSPFQVLATIHENPNTMLAKTHENQILVSAGGFALPPEHSSTQFGGDLVNI